MAYNAQLIFEDVEKQRLATQTRRRKTLCERMDGQGKSFLLMFLDTSSIHGLNHFTKTRRHPLEIALWLAIVGCALWGALYLSSQTWQRYQDSPTVVSMDRNMFAWNTTFPCVTVCPHTKINEKKMDTFLTRTKLPDKPALEKFIRSLAVANYSNFLDIPEYTALQSKDYMDLIVNLSMNFNPGLTIGASGISLFLEPTITELGVCYAVNSKMAVYNSHQYRTSNRWDIVEGNATFFIHPMDGEIFAQLINLSTGYDMFVHGPLEFPDIASQRLVSEDGMYMKLYVTALTILTSAEAAKLSIQQRKCRFHDESNLVHSPVYSYNLCRIDCRISLCQKLCGCVPHFYRARGKEKYCDVKGLHSLAQHEDLLLSLYDPKTKKKSCECLPNCNDVNYVIESMSLQKWFLGTNLQWGIVTYPRMRFLREILFGFTDVLVSVGGMAGLFLGCSVLSFMEIVYFFTLRLFWYIANSYNKSNGNNTKVLMAKK